MDDEDLKKEIESPLTGDDNAPSSMLDDRADDDMSDRFDRELNEGSGTQEVFSDNLGGASRAEKHQE